MIGAERPLWVLFICTGNSARSQIAEALLTRKGAGRFRVASAGSHPAMQVNPLAVRVLAEQGIEWSGRMPRGMDGLEREPWDIVITVCDKAKEACPILPGQPVLAHWGMPDEYSWCARRGATHQRWRDSPLRTNSLKHRVEPTA